MNQLEGQIVEIRQSKIELYDEINKYRNNEDTCVSKEGIHDISDNERVKELEKRLVEMQKQIEEVMVKSQDISEDNENLKRELHSRPSLEDHTNIISEKKNLSLLVSRLNEKIDNQQNELERIKSIQPSDDNKEMMKILEQENSKHQRTVEELNNQLFSMIDVVSNTNIEIESLKKENGHMKTQIENYKENTQLPHSSKHSSLEIEAIIANNKQLETNLKQEQSKKEKLVRDKLFMEIELAKKIRELDQTKLQVRSYELTSDKDKEIDLLKERISILESSTDIKRTEEFKQQISLLNTAIDEVILL